MADPPGSSTGELQMSANDGERKTPQELLSREEQLCFRTITTFLSWTERWSLPAEGEQPPTPKQGYKRNSKDRAFVLLTSLANVLVRHKEVLAIVPFSLKNRTAQSLKIFLEHNNPADELPGRYIATTNPQRRNADHRPGKEVLSDERKFRAPALRATFCKNNNPLKQHGDSGTVEFFFHNGGDQMPFDMHVDRFTYLLKRWHAEQSGSPLKTSEAKASLQAYIYLACRQKLYSRIRRGKRQRNAHGKPYGLNIYQFLTIDDVNFKLKHDQIHKDRLSNDLPSEDERTVLEEWARVAKFTAEEKTDLAERPVYDMAGRKRFHRILRLALITSSEAVTGLLEAVNEQMAKPLEVGSAGEIKRFSAIRTMAVQAAMLFEMLSDFIFSFHTTLVKHLEWLEVVFHLERTTKTPLQSSSDPPSSYVPPSSPPSNVVDGSDFQPPSDIEQQIPSTPFEDDEKDVVTLDEENFVKLTEKLGLAEVGEDEEDEQDDTDQIQELLRKGWHVAALKYLDVICLYTDALTNLERGKLTTAIVLGLDIQVISATPEFKDNVMLPVKAVLDDTYFCSDEEERSAIVKFIMNQSYIGAIHHRSATEPPDTELEVPFNGTWHCEAILLSLAIAKTLGVPSESSTYHIEPEVLDHLKEYKRDVLGVSKRCCPACGKLVELIREGQRFGEKLIAPGKHSKWSGVALPPWLHRKYAEPILAYAKNVLRDRFKLIIQEQQENDLKRTRGEASLSAESTGIGEESPAAVRKKARECRSKFPSVGFSPTKLGRQEDSSGYINEDKS